MQETSLLWIHTDDEFHFSTNRRFERDGFIKRLKKYGHLSECHVSDHERDGEWDSCVITGPMSVLRRSHLSITTGQGASGET